ncbi:MAG: hypothetical protein V8R46_01780, partial [Eubacterium ramulus]
KNSMDLKRKVKEYEKENDRTCISTDSCRSNDVWRNGMRRWRHQSRWFGSESAANGKHKGANVPNVTYTYTITAGSAIGATANSPEVKAGVGLHNYFERNLYKG